MKMEKMLKQFVEDLKTIFKDKFISFIVYGSVTLNDFKPSKGDIDFLVILKENISNEEIKDIIKLHEDLRSYKYGILGSQLEGAYYTKGMFLNNSDKNHKGFYVGTKRKGWKVINELFLNAYDKKNIIENGLVVDGEDVKNLIVEPTMEEIKCFFLKELDNRIQLTKSFKDVEFLIDTVFLTLRGISLCEFETIVSKSASVNQYIELNNDINNITFIKYMSNYRLPLEKKDFDIIDSKYIEQYGKNWLRKIYKKYYVEIPKNV